MGHGGSGFEISYLFHGGAEGANYLQRRTSDGRFLWTAHALPNRPIWPRIASKNAPNSAQDDNAYLCIKNLTLIYVDTA
jgi:hypothetical protein